MINKLNALFVVFNDKIGNRPFLVSVRKGLTYLIPILLIGSMALVFMSLPIPAYQNGMTHLFGPNWKDLFQYIRDGSFSILSLLMVVTISYSYATEYTETKHLDIPPIIVTVVALGSFTAITGISKDGFSLSNFGAVGVFTALMVTYTSSVLFLNLCKVDFLKLKSYTDGADSTFQYAITAIFPAAITIFVFAVVDQALDKLCGIADIQGFISNILSNFFGMIHSPYLSAILFMILIHLFWVFGIHGSNVLEPVAQSFFVPALAANQAAVSMGQAPIHVFTKTFFDTFVLMGGCGGALCLVLAIFLAGRHKNIRRQAKLSVIPVLFNINELIVFGIPIVLNPVYILPFLIVPLLLTTVSFLAMHIGLVPYTTQTVEWTTPIFISGYTATGSISGSLLQLFNLAIGTACYIPFVRAAEKISTGQLENSLNRVYTTFKRSEEKGIRVSLLNRHDEVGNICRLLTADLEFDMTGGNIMLHYQPQVDCDGRVFGAEALLRWKHKSCGILYPPLVIALAEEAQLIDRLGYIIIDTACADLEKWHTLGIRDMVMSVNVSAVQLESEAFPLSLEDILQKHHLSPGDLKIEITEQVALSGGKRIYNNLQKVKDMGVKLAMDDFGMGHSSLMYLKEYAFDTIKLDGSLIKELVDNCNCQNIVSTIVSLGHSMNYSVIAEYVEIEEQRNILHELGCDLYQGYLYSKALPGEELVEYVFHSRAIQNEYADADRV